MKNTKGVIIGREEKKFKTCSLERCSNWRLWRVSRDHPKAAGKKVSEIQEEIQSCRVSRQPGEECISVRRWLSKIQAKKDLGI